MPNQGFTSVTHVIHAINRMRNETPAKSVPSPSAQNFDSCNAGAELQEIQMAILNALEHWKRSWPLLYYFAMIQSESGARVSEILRIHSTDITPEGRIRLYALKRGNPRVIRVPEIIPWLIRERSFQRNIFMDLNRFAIHREYVKQGIAAYFGQNTKRSTTHLFRHLVGIDLNQLKDGTHAIRHGLGQKTDTAADHYKTTPRRKDH